MQIPYGVVLQHTGKTNLASFNNRLADCLVRCLCTGVHPH